MKKDKTIKDYYNKINYKSRYPILNILISITSYIQAVMDWLVINTVRGFFRWLIKD